MSYTWVFLVLFYGLAKGVREGLKKKSLEKSSVMEVLFFYTVIAFIMIIPFSRDVFDIPPIYYLWIFIKSFVIFISWILAFISIKRMPISYYGVIDLARVLFSTALAVIFLGETITLNKGIGLLLVIAGIALVNVRSAGDEKIRVRYLIVALFSCVLNAVSGFLDKELMATHDITANQLQFWYMLFMSLLYAAYILCTKTKVRIGTLKTNYWILILSALFVVADRALFIANADPNSQVTVMTLIKQSSVIVTVMSGKFIFHETHIAKRAACAAVVVAGIIVASL